MLDLPDSPLLDKHSLVGGCIRLTLRPDVDRLQRELNSLPADLWGSRGGRVGVHDAAEAIFLRGYAPAEGDKPIEERPALSLMPEIRSLITQRLSGRPMRCLLAKLPAGATVAPHRDQAPYFHKTIRLHVPIVSNPKAWMFCASMAYRMEPGEIWALNNAATHAVWNAHPTLSRTHLICDFIPDAALLKLLEDGERNLGRADAALERNFMLELRTSHRSRVPTA
jgi:hypothetical protein